MRIEKTAASDHAVLALKGEFDTLYVPAFTQEIDGLAASGITRAVLNLRFLRFVNSTALGAIVKAQKKLRAAGGDLVISQPSAFCRDLFEKVGLDRVIRIFEDDADAVFELADTARPDVAVEDAATVLFSYVDAGKAAYAPRPVEIGRIRQLDDHGIEFEWNASKTGLQNADVQKLLEPGTQLRLKFKIPLAKKDYFELTGRVEHSELPRRGIGIRVRAKFGQVGEGDRKALAQFVNDMRFLKNELRQATES